MPVKQRRISRACDYCHQRSIRCRPCSNDGATCQNCKDFSQACTFNRTPRRRGVRPRASQGTTHRAVDANFNPPRPSVAHDHHPCVSHGVAEARQAAPTPWQAPFIASQATIVDLVELYFEIVYPIFPLFHQPTFTRRISRAEYTTTRSLFATTMAVCALVSGRVRDGSVTNPRWDLQGQISPDVFYHEARRQLAGEWSADLENIRAHAILAVAAIQNGRTREMQEHLGMYHTLVAMEGLHDEANWPQDIGIVEREERRRLFWSIYTLDIYTAVVWGGIVRSREQQSNVSYPLEVDDEFINDTGVVAPSPTMTTSGISPTYPDSDIPTSCWLSGWNFITDLYRVLEHALARFRGHHNRNRHRRRRGSLLRDIFEDHSTATEESVRENVMQMYLNLPSCFKETPEMKYDAKKDRFGYQAANATASLQLVRMVLFAAGGASIEERCRIASDVVNAFVSIPVTYLLAISMPLLHHLAGIGTILGSVFEEPLSESDYSQVRTVMLSMAQLLENLEAIHQSSSASQRLRSQVARIDEYMNGLRQGPAMEATELHGEQPANIEPAAESAVEYQYQTEQDLSQAWSFQVPPALLDELMWSFEVNQP